MSTTLKLGTETPVGFTSFSIQAISGIVRKKTWASINLALSKMRNERYNMRSEDLIRGPLSDEVRRAPWL